MEQLEQPSALDSRTAAIMNVTPRPPLVFVRGEGTRIWDDSGRGYLDFVQGWAVNAFGHAPRMVREALAGQAATLISPGPGFFNEPSIRLADALTRHSTFDRVFFANSGAEANEGAIKLARRWGARHRGGAYEIVTFAHSFHGRTLATMAASGKPAFRDLFEPKVPGFPKAVLNDPGYAKSSPFAQPFLDSMDMVIDFWAEPSYAQLLLAMQKRVHDYVVADKGTAKEALDGLVADWRKVFKEDGKMK